MSDVKNAPEAAKPDAFVAPYIGSREMPRWNTGELIDAPVFTWRNWFAMLGPAVIMAGSAIGGGEWLMGPAITAHYGGSLMWLATLSVLGQVFYNLEISRYALYTGEPIFTGKFRTLPGPRFWLFIYLVLDFGSVFPYLASNAATPVAAIYLGHIPEPADQSFVKGLSFAVLLLAMMPLMIGGKIYNTLKAIMAFKVVTVLGFLVLVAICFTTPATWSEILTGFVSFGTVPVEETVSSEDSQPVNAERPHPSPGRVNTKVDNIFVSLWEGRGFPKVDLETIALLAAFAAIAGQGGLSNAPVSNYTRDQGWGMGHLVGAIPSAFGGRSIALSHVGCVFEVTAESLPRWRRWLRHVRRDQFVVWLPACFLGIALPSMLSLQFLPRGTVVSEWFAAGMTADGVRSHVSDLWGPIAGATFWYLTLVCGFLVLAPTASSSADGVIRRWVDVCWTSSPMLRSWDPKNIKLLYFGVLAIYTTFGLLMLMVGKPLGLLTVATNIMNFALGFSCWHVLVVNHLLLPRELRGSWFVRLGLFFAGVFFFTLAIVTAVCTLMDD